MSELKSVQQTHDQLTQLKKYTTVVADTGDIDQIEAYSPQDATTNPSLLLKAVQQEKYQEYFQTALEKGKTEVNLVSQIRSTMGHLTVNFGEAILKLIPGRVSTEVEASLSFDCQATIDRARDIIALYQQKSIERDRVLIKIAATWEGICAAKVLEKEGIHCNLTLMFHPVQAVACAEAGVTLISPFVGRIYDFYVQEHGHAPSIEQDPGIQSVRDIYNYFRHYDYPTIVMGASFRHVDQIRALAGCDYLTISPKLLNELQNSQSSLSPLLSEQHAKQQKIERIDASENAFRWHMNQSAMATEKLAHGIRAFHQDTQSLEQMIEKALKP